MRQSLRWPIGAEVRHKPIRGGAMLYDASRAGNADASWFDRLWWSRRGEVRETAEGRGAAVFIEADARQLVLRHYRRGGWMAHLSRGRCLWHGEALTRGSVDRADAGGSLARLATALRATGADQLDCHWPLSAPFPRRWHLSCRSECAQCAAGR